MRMAGASFAIFRSFKWMFPLAFALQILRIGIQFVPGLLLWRLFNELGRDSRVTSTVWLLVALMVAGAAARLVILLSAVFVEATCTQYTAALIRSNTLDRILRRPGGQALAMPVGDAVTRLNLDAFAIGSFLSFATLNVADFLVMILAISLMGSINAGITLAVLVPTLLAGLIVNRTGGRIERLRHARRIADANVSTLIVEAFGAVQAVQVATAEQRVARTFNELSRARRSSVLREKVFEQIVMRGMIDNVALLSTGMLLLVAGRSIHSGAFSLGDFALFMFFAPVISDSIFHYGLCFATGRQARVAWERLRELSSDEDDQRLVEPRPLYMRGELPAVPSGRETRLDPPLRRLDVSNLSYTYPSSGGGIKDVSFRLDHGSFTVITGRVGAGKTTCLRVMLGLLPSEAGVIYWNGVPVEDRATWFAPPRCAYTPQVPRLFSATLRENILLGRDDDEEQLARAVWQAVMESDRTQLDEGLDTRVGVRGVMLSGGQQQRAAAARMFVRRADLLVVDDLSSALDVVTEGLMWERLLRTRELTCLAVSHRRSALERADRIVVLKAGRVESSGSLEELLEVSDEIKEIWHTNLKEEVAS